MNYLKVARATELQGKERFVYRLLEILPGFLSIGTLLVLIIFSYFQPVWVAYFLIGFNVYYFLLVIFLAIYLINAYDGLLTNKKINWRKKCEELPNNLSDLPEDSLAKKGWLWSDVVHMVILPTYNESLDVLRDCFNGLINKR